MDRFAAAVTLLCGAMDNGEAVLLDNGDHILATDPRYRVPVRPNLTVEVKATISSRLAVSAWVDVVNSAGLAPDEGVRSLLIASTVQLEVVRFTRTKAEALRLAAVINERARA